MDDSFWEGKPQPRFKLYRAKAGFNYGNIYQPGEYCFSYDTDCVKEAKKNFENWIFAVAFISSLILALIMARIIKYYCDRNMRALKVRIGILEERNQQ